jgi:hypothetical protein
MLHPATFFPSEKSIACIPWLNREDLNVKSNQSDHPFTGKPPDKNTTKASHKV